MSGRLAVGVDAGGTTVVALASEDGVAGEPVTMGPANASVQGVDAAAGAIARAVTALVADRAFTLFVAAAGAGRDSIARELEERLHAAFPAAENIAVEDDTKVALRSAIPQGPGVVLIAGTGSVAYGENDDVRARVGGAGYLLGDEGSAFSIGFSALRLLARVYDARARSDETTELVARALSVHDRSTLLAFTYAAPLDVRRVAGLAPGIVALAGEGNRASTKIVQNAAGDLAELARAAVQQVNLAQSSPTIAFRGGLLRENSLLTFLLQTRLCGDFPGAQVIRGGREAVRAALEFAEAAWRS